MAKKTENLLGNRNTESETWQKIRTELRDDISAAFKLAVEHDASNALGRMLGLNETARRLAIEKAISGPFVKNPDWLVLKIQQIKEAAFVPVEAFDFFRIFLNQYAHEFEKKCGNILGDALPLAEAELAAAIATEESFFAEGGLPRQETPVSQGVARVVEKLKYSQAHFARLLQSPWRQSYSPPAPGYLPEIFADEIAKHAASMAEMSGTKLAA